MIRERKEWLSAFTGRLAVDALILSDPDFWRARRVRLNIGCPVLVISLTAGQAASRASGSGRLRRDRNGQYVRPATRSVAVKKFRK